MVVVYLPAEKMLFNSDMYSPGRPAPLTGHTLSRAKELKAAIEQSGLPVETIVGGHGGGTVSLADFIAHVEQ